MGDKYPSSIPNIYLLIGLGGKCIKGPLFLGGPHALSRKVGAVFPTNVPIFFNSYSKGLYKYSKNKLIQFEINAFYCEILLKRDRRFRRDRRFKTIF